MLSLTRHPPTMPHLSSMQHPSSTMLPLLFMLLPWFTLPLWFTAPQFTIPQLQPPSTPLLWSMPPSMLPPCTVEPDKCPTSQSKAFGATVAAVHDSPSPLNGAHSGRPVVAHVGHVAHAAPHHGAVVPAFVG